jgi:GNAT superfamily N-acetyltransferase
MSILLQPVRSARDVEIFIHFPWRVNREDPHWVPPLLDDRRSRLDGDRNHFWRAMRREWWLALRDGEPAGTIAAFYPISAPAGGDGIFGFFDCVDDLETAGCLLSAAEEWLRAQGASRMRGPFNPGENDDPGVLSAGFNSRPAIMEAHNPPYYCELFDRLGFTVENELVARLLVVPGDLTAIEECMPERLRRVAERAGTRKDLRIRRLDRKHWLEEIHLAWEIFNAALAGVPGVVPVSWEEFLQTAEGFRPILWPDLAWMAEVGGKPAGFVLAFPDINEILCRLNGRLGPLNLLRLWWGSRHLKRVSLKILMVLPEYQGRGVEAVLIRELGRAIFRRGFREIDMSLTGENNEKSQRFQEHLGFKVYRRYRIYEKRYSQ